MKKNINKLIFCSIIFYSSISSSSPLSDLISAAEKGDSDGVKKALKDREGWSSLHWAIFRYHMETIQFLLEKGADIEIKNNDGETPLMMACSMHREWIIHYFIKKGADLNAVDKEGKSIIQREEKIGHTKIDEILKNAGAK